MTASSVIPYEPCNEVRLIGHVTADPDLLVLPSGDELIKTRVSVPRPRPPAGQGKRAGMDTVECVAWEAPVRRDLRLLCPGDVVEVRGALRREVRTTPGGVRSYFSIELATATLVRQAAAVNASSA